jgi:geranylgeranyl diphosphate synthase type II
VRILSRAAGSLYLVGGQVADLEGEGQEPTPERVSFIHERKTAELIAASQSIGSALAGAGRSELDEIHQIGRKAGYAFQIIDDLLDVEGSEGAVGKGLRKDSKKGKITHPASFGTARSREIAGELIVEAKEGIAKLGDKGYITHLFSLIVDRVS